MFEKAGLSLTPWPVDFRTDGRRVFRPLTNDPVAGLDLFSTALREHIGLWVYRLSGRA